MMHTAKKHAHHANYTPFCPWAGMLALAGGVALAACQWLIFVYAPVEATLGLPQKIFYLHVPLAWWGMLSFFLTFVASALYLKNGNPRWDMLAESAAEAGLLLAGLALVAGSVWARASWGVWWIWDARLTTTLIMCFTYAGYLIIRRLDMPEIRRNKVAAVVGIVAFLDVPLVYISSRLWSFIHPPSVQLDSDMRLVMWLCVGACSFFWAGLVTLRFSLAATERTLNTLTARLLAAQSNKD